MHFSQFSSLPARDSLHAARLLSAHFTLNPTSRILLGPSTGYPMVSLNFIVFVVICCSFAPASQLREHICTRSSRCKDAQTRPVLRWLQCLAHPSQDDDWYGLNPLFRKVPTPFWSTSMTYSVLSPRALRSGPSLSPYCWRLLPTLSGSRFPPV